jgi:leader peptidase (prepilin peptidase)/N-methyltransferase
MGGGDIKLMFALGSFLGYIKTLWALVLAFIFAAVFSIVLLILKIKHRKDYIPFGPFIALGTFISFLFLK